MIPEFINVGQPDMVLPDGIHEATLDEVYEALVAPFPDSTTRADIFAGWSAFSRAIHALVPVEVEFLDGSFVTSREHPDDMDISMWIRADDMDALPPLDQLSLTKLRRTAKKAFNCDAYLLPKCGQNHSEWPTFEYMRGWTRKYWKAYKDPDDVVVDGIAKGYLKVTS